MRYHYRQAACSGLMVLLLSQLLLLHPQPCTAITAEALQAIVPLSQLSSSALASGAFTDLSSLGGPAVGIDSALLSWLQQALVGVFTMDGNSLAALLTGAAGGFVAGTAAGAAVGFKAGMAVGSMGPGPLPPLPLPPLKSGHPLAPWAQSHDKVLRVLADQWASMLAKVQFSPGLQGFLQLLGLTELQEALVKWMCIIYPWQVDMLIPEAIRDVRDSYCIRALPAAAVSHILAGPPKPGVHMSRPGLPDPGPSSAFGGPGLPGTGLLG